jgi:hypothetical protein
MRHSVATIAFLLSSTLLQAQWPKYPTPGLPRTADNKPDLSAPAPKAADGKPDLSGVWMARNASFYLAGDLKPEDMRPWAAALYKQREANFRRETDGIRCLPPGPKAGIGLGDFPMKVVQTPSLIVVLYEYQTIYRQIFTDGRPLPPEEANPTWMGYSIGHWEGDTLVVTTAGYNDRTSMDLAGHPHTEALRMTERFHRRDAGHLDVQITFDDPKTYTRSWTIPFHFDLLPDTNMIEYVCENERDSRHLVGASGEEFALSPEDLARYVGAYESPNRAPILISLEDGRLMIKMGAAGKIPLVAHSQNSFTMEGTGVEFSRDAKGNITSLVQHWTEGDRPYVRKD